MTGGFDVADNHIVQQVLSNDLVIAADIHLAATVIGKGGHALKPRGELYNRENIKERLVLRDLMDELRGSGITTVGPDAISLADRRGFANELEQF